MKKVIVASKNPVKIDATKIGFANMFPDEEMEITGVSVPSGVNDQPITDEETLEGAQNRASNVQKKIPEADYWVGIEGGVSIKDTTMQAFAWVIILSGSKEGKAKTAAFFLPEKVVQLVNEGKELGEADDIIFGHTNSKQKNGAVGILTNDAIDRTKYYAEAVTLALIPFKNPDLY